MPVPAAQACLRAAVPKRLSCRPRLRFMVRHLRNAVARCISKHWLAARERAPRSLSPPSERRQAAGGVRCSSMCPAGTSRSRTGDTNTTLSVSEALAVHGSKPVKHCRPHFAANDRHAYCSARTPWRIQIASGATRYSKAETEGARSLRRTIYIRCERGLGTSVQATLESPSRSRIRSAPSMAAGREQPRRPPRALHWPNVDQNISAAAHAQAWPAC